MSLALLLPLGLFALAALIVPILIHLLRRPEHQATDFAALRWVGERMRPRRRLRFDDPWLLLVRLLLIAAIALLLARPVLDRDWRGARTWIAVAPDVDLNAARAQLGDVEGEWHWLAPGFPAIDSAAPALPVAMASLARELDAIVDARAALILVVPSAIEDLDGGRIVLGRAVDWRIIEPTAAELSAVATPPAPVLPAPVLPAPVLHVALRYGAASEPSLRYIRAVVAAWNTDAPGAVVLDEAAADVAVGADAKWLFWTAGNLSAAAEAWVRSGGRALTIDAAKQYEGSVRWRDENGTAIAHARAIGEGQHIVLTRDLDPQALPQLLEADFPERVRQLFADAPRAPTRGLASGANPRVGSRSSTPAVFSLDALLAIVIATLFLLERVFATRERAPR